jgi:protein-S-isoprenylcysteine O-methyltransferase Ste14
MPAVKTTQTLHPQGDPDVWVRLGGWLFTQRTWLPLPIAVALLALPREGLPTPFLGTLLVVSGEGLRVWAVHHIGEISRTRSDRLGPLISTGPFALARNPLYLGNIALWAGFALTAGLAWTVPAILALLALEYHAIVRWEERLLESRRGEEYRAYAARVPRWIPRVVNRAPAPAVRLIPDPAAHSWRHTLFSERGTLVAIGVGYVLLWIKSRF